MLTRHVLSLQGTLWTAVLLTQTCYFPQRRLSVHKHPVWKICEDMMG